MRVLILTWRDSGHPEAGGAEIFVERVSGELVALGHAVTVFTASYPGAPRAEERSRRAFLRRGGRYSVYGRAAGHLLRRGADYDVVLDIQNGVPFWTPLWCTTPVVNVVHHVHREQWPEVFGPVRAGFGWWLESQVAPRVYARQRYLTVSQATREELVSLGVDRERVDVVYSGNDLPPGHDVPAGRSATPLLLVLGRLVPHKRVELAIDAVAALRDRVPDVRLVVAGQGYWQPELQAHAAKRGVADRVEFLGFVEEDVKQRLLAEAWLHLLPSVKEGWGLVVVEAGYFLTPTVAFRDARGTTESVVDGVTGLLVADEAEFSAAVADLLLDEGRRTAMGEAARIHATGFTWRSTAEGVEQALLRAVGAPLADQESVPQGEL